MPIFCLKYTWTKHQRKLQKNQNVLRQHAKVKKKYMNKLKESILNDVKKGSGDTTSECNEATSATNNASNETTSVTNTASTRPNDTYVYGVGILAVVAIGVPVFFAYNTNNALLTSTWLVYLLSLFWSDD